MKRIYWCRERVFDDDDDDEENEEMVDLLVATDGVCLVLDFEYCVEL